MSIRIKIEEPCHEDWGKMKIGINSRHCDSCQKNVMDFTEKSRQEIIAYMLMHPGEQICGRMRTSQLDYSIEEVKLVAEDLMSKTLNLLQKEMIAASLVIILSAYDANASNNTQMDQNRHWVNQEDKIEINAFEYLTIKNQPEDTLVKNTKQSDTTDNRSDKLFPDTLKLRDHTVMCTHNGPNITGELIVGKLQYVPRKKDPEYKFGHDSLVSGIINGLYSSLSNMDTFKGTKLQIQVSISRGGRIKSIKIQDTQDLDSKLEKALKRSIRKMKDWTPAKMEGKKRRGSYIIYLEL